MSNEMEKCITAELNKREIQYAVTTNKNGLATITLDAKQIATAREILMQVFEQQDRQVAGSVLLRQKKITH
jgi:histidinol phosphatase-like enzyme